MLDAARRNEYAGLINDSGHHLLAVVNGILDMSKIETGNFEITPEPFAPAQVIAGCCDLLALRARRGRRRARANAGRRRSAGNDRRQARAQSDPAQSPVERDPLHRSRRQGDGRRPRRGARSIIFVVEDTGVGISDDDLARVGEPYFQARASYDRRHGGTGLGLSIVKGLVRLHGGEIHRSAAGVGEGTRVSVRLPLDCERVQHAKGRAAKPAAEVTSYLAAHAPNGFTARPTRRRQRQKPLRRRSTSG